MTSTRTRNSSGLGLATMFVALGVGGCGDASGCDDFNPASGPLAVGESAVVELEIVDGSFGQLDIAGAYWVTDAPVPPELPQNGTVSATAELTDGQVVPAGVIEGVVTAELDGGGTVVFDGPIGCD